LNNIACSIEKDPGPCQGEFYRWYFDTASEQCMEFLYSGCGGNKNLFLNKAECEQTCEKLIVKKTVGEIKYFLFSALVQNNAFKSFFYLCNWQYQF
jgi:Kunitz/Bovine pancreatic trypsin inhibitor domain